MNCLVHLRRISLLLLLAGLLASSLITNLAQAKPVRVAEPLRVKGDELGTVTISALILQAPELDDIMIVKEKYVVMMLEEMRRHGYRALGRENLSLNQDRSNEAEFILGGVIVAADCGDEQGVTCGISIDWQLMDRRSGAIVYRVTSRHEEMGMDELERSVAGNQLLLGSLRSVLARPKFVAALKGNASPAPPVDVAAFPPGQIRACAARSLTMPKMSAEVLNATALVKVGDGVGSAVFISPDGLLLTAAHVATTAEVTVRFKDGKEGLATVLRVNDSKDVALLKLKDATRVTPCLALRIEKPETGEDVFALGAPGGEKLSFSVTRGIVSGARNFDGTDFIQTDTSISPGNSGGPLVDTKGQVVAIMSWKVSGGGIEGLAFGVPSAAALSGLNLQPGESTSALKVERLHDSGVVTGSGSVLDQPDPPWFYVGKDAAGKTPGWVGQARGWGWVSVVVGGVTIGTTAGLNAALDSPDSFSSLRTWNTVGWVVGSLGATLVVSSYLFAPSRRPPSSARSARSRPQIAAGIGVPGIGPAAMSIFGSF